MAIESVSNISKKANKKLAKKIKKDIEKESMKSPNGVCIIYYYPEDGIMERAKALYIDKNKEEFEKLGYSVDVERDFWDDIYQLTLSWKIDKGAFEW